jgi:hypothetical protein
VSLSSSLPPAHSKWWLAISMVSVISGTYEIATKGIDRQGVIAFVIVFVVVLALSPFLWKKRS